MTHALTQMQYRFAVIYETHSRNTFDTQYCTQSHTLFHTLYLLGLLTHFKYKITHNGYHTMSPSHGSISVTHILTIEDFDTHYHALWCTHGLSHNLCYPWIYFVHTYTHLKHIHNQVHCSAHTIGPHLYSTHSHTMNTNAHPQSHTLVHTRAITQSGPQLGLLCMKGDIRVYLLPQKNQTYTVLIHR